MAKTQITAPETVTWIPTRADTVETDAAGNVLAVNGVPVQTPAPKPELQDAVDS